MNEEIRNINGETLELVVERTATERATTIVTVALVLSLASPLVLGLAGLGWRLFRHFAGW